MEFTLNLMALNSKIMKAFCFLVLMIINLLVVSVTSAQSEKIVRVKGEAQVRIENNESFDQAKERVEELAKLDAIQEAFGTYVEQVTDMLVEEGKVNYSILAGTKMKADWIRTTSIKFSEQEQLSGISKEKARWIKCNIEGEARKISSKASLEVLSLRCPQKECAATDFKNRQSLFLYFKSPVDGYLSVYIDEGEVTRRLYPYDHMGNESSVKVSGDREYLLFAKPPKSQAPSMVDEIELFTNKTEEFNTLYVVFSEQSYVKPILDKSMVLSDNSIVPKSLPSHVFQDWLADSRAASSSFQEKKIRIRITKR